MISARKTWCGAFDVDLAEYFVSLYIMNHDKVAQPVNLLRTSVPLALPVGCFAT